MKVFVSWSGELSKRVAEILKRKIPCIIQSVEVFYSPNDIQKGENWDAKLVEELANSDFGIVCLTQQNVNAPWVHFESGALSKALDSRVSALMIGINPSDIQGPLKRFQATKIEKEDFKLLITSINNAAETPLKNEVLEETFNMVWASIDNEVKQILSSVKQKTNQPPQKEERENSQAIEEILALLRKQNNMLSNPEQFIPQSYIMPMLVESSRMTMNNKRYIVDNEIIEKFLYNITNWIENGVYVLRTNYDNNNYKMIDVYEMLDFDKLIYFVISVLERSPNNKLSASYREEMLHKLMELRKVRETFFDNYRDNRLQKK